MRTRFVYRPSPLLLVMLILFGGGLPGCGPSLTSEDLGTVDMKVPKLPGSEGPYPMPELEPAADSSASATPQPADLVPKPPAEPVSDEKN